MYDANASHARIIDCHLGAGWYVVEFRSPRGAFRSEKVRAVDLAAHIEAFGRDCVTFDATTKAMQARKAEYRASNIPRYTEDLY
jgi:hypothetical protein